MLILDDGHWVDAISGGCQEGDVLRKAWEVMRSIQSRHIIYDKIKDKSSDNIPFSMGCEEIIEVLIEPLEQDLDPFHPILIFKEYATFNQKLLKITLYDFTHESMGQPGEGLHINHHGKMVDNLSNQNVREIVIRNIEKLAQWDHSFQKDLEVLRGLLKTDIRYIGILGPKKRIRIMMEQLEKEEKESRTDVQKRIYAPVGLNIGAETPDEIALSIITEILAIHNQMPGGFLKDKKGHIHER